MIYQKISSAVALGLCMTWPASLRGAELVSQNWGASAYSASRWAEEATGAEPDKAFDGIIGGGWNAGDYATPAQWLEVDLQHVFDVTSVRMFVNQLPEGNTIHEVWVA